MMVAALIIPPERRNKRTGIPLKVLLSLMGHKSISSTERSLRSMWRHGTECSAGYRSGDDAERIGLTLYRLTRQRLVQPYVCPEASSELTWGWIEILQVFLP